MDFLGDLQASVRPLSTGSVLLNLSVAFVLGLIISVVYRITNRKRAINRSFLLTMVIMSMVVALVMMVIGNSIARAFSLVGALSIIRFRTVVKDNRDIAYIFFGLAAGMASGIGAIHIAVFGVGLILFFILLLDFVEFGQGRRGLYLLRFQMIPTDTDKEAYEHIFDQNLVSYRSLAMKTVRMGQFIEHGFLVRLKPGVREKDFITSLSALEGMERVSLLEESAEPE